MGRRTEHPRSLCGGEVCDSTHIQHFIWITVGAKLALICFVLNHSKSHLYCYVKGPPGYSQTALFEYTARNQCLCLRGLESKDWYVVLIWRWPLESNEPLGFWLPLNLACYVVWRGGGYKARICTYSRAGPIRTSLFRLHGKLEFCSLGSGSVKGVL